MIVSGGDPLTMNMDLLDWFLGELERISHVEVLRIGSRVPVVLPMRINDELVRMLASHGPSGSTPNLTTRMKSRRMRRRPATGSSRRVSRCPTSPCF